MMDIVWLILAIILLLVGLIGTVVPMLPGIPFIFAGFLVWGLGSGWKDYGLVAMCILALVTVGTVLLDFWAGALGAKRFGASTSGIIGAVVGCIVGLVFFNLPGLILGPFVGAVLGELITGKAGRKAVKAGAGAFIGFVAGSLFKIIVGLAMCGYFAFALIF